MTIVTVILSLLCIFEVICVPAVFLRVSLNGVIFIYLITAAAFLAMLLYRRSLKREKSGQGGRRRVKPDERIADTDEKDCADVSRIRIVCFLLILFQLVLVTAYRHTDDDDAWYLGNAVSAYETGELFAYSPYTGNEMVLSDARDYVLSPLPIFWAALGKIMHIHPTVLAHTVAPGFLLLSAYSVYWLLAKRLFAKKEDKRQAWFFLLFINILNLFGFYSTRTSGVFLLFRSWQGKAVFCAILVPLLFYYFLGLLSLPAGNWQKDGAGDICRERKELLGIFLTMGAGCMVSFSAVTMMPLLLLAMALTCAVAKRALRIPLKMCLSVIPNMVLILLYLFAM